MSGLKSEIKSSLRAAYHACLSFASRDMERELAQRNLNRGVGAFGWLTPQEAVIAAALGKIIVPSDDETPGLDDIDVLGPSAIETLDKLILKDLYRQELYARGLLAFDRWAVWKHGRPFVELTETNQADLLRQAQRYSEKLAAASRPARAWQKIHGVVRASRGALFAAQLYPEIRNDCMRIFYTSRVSWVWLEYDGPPMDEGYPKLQPRR